MITKLGCLARGFCNLVLEVMWTNIYDKPGWDTDLELEYDVMPRDEFGVPAHIPPEISTTIRHAHSGPACPYMMQALIMDARAFCRVPVAEVLHPTSVLPFPEEVGRRYPGAEATRLRFARRSPPN